MNQGPRRGETGKARRTETVTVRLDPKLRYLAEIAARKQRRTLSSFIDWAVEQALNSVKLREGPRGSVLQMTGELWDVDEPDRFVKLAMAEPGLLTHQEERLWKLIRDCAPIWTQLEPEAKPGGEVFVFDPQELRRRWDSFRALADGRESMKEAATSDSTKGSRFKSGVGRG